MTRSGRFRIATQDFSYAHNASILLDMVTLSNDLSSSSGHFVSRDGMKWPLNSRLLLVQIWSSTLV